VALADVRRIKSILKKPTKAMIAEAILPKAFAGLEPAARDFKAATHIATLRFTDTPESQLTFEDPVAAPEAGA